MSHPSSRALVVLIVAALPLLVVAATLAGGPTADLGLDPNGLPTAVAGIEGVQQALYRDGRVLIGGQPTEQALERLRGLGVTAVVNLRTPAEMEDRERVPYDEAAAVERLGMAYVSIPLGGDARPYTPEAVDRFAQVLAGHSGPVFLHCTIGWRASYLWTAYLIREHGMAPSAAYARGRAIAIPPSPLEGLLGKPLTVVFEDKL